MSKKQNKSLKKKEAELQAVRSINSLTGITDIKFKDNFIQIGNVKLSNIDLRSIVRKSEQISMDDKADKEQALQNDPEFMKSLNAYAAEKSKEIINDTVFSEDIKKSPPSTSESSDASPSTSTNSIKKAINLTKPVHQSINVQVIRKEDTASESKKICSNQKIDNKGAVASGVSRKCQMTEKLVNPGGLDSPCYVPRMNLSTFFPQQETSEDLVGDELRIAKKMYPSLQESKLFLETPDKIGRGLLEPNFPLSFRFTVDFYYGLTGIVRQVHYMYSGANTFKSFYLMFKHRFGEGENMQWFYMNHKGRLMEIRDTNSLKQMMICHGAYPKGITNTIDTVGKIMCIFRNSQIEDYVFERESDLVCGALNYKEMSRQEGVLDRHLQFQLAPDSRYLDVYDQLVQYTEDDYLNPYNQFEDVLQLVLHCQRRMSIRELFSDHRNFDVTEIELKTLVDDRFHDPFRGCTREQSVRLEVKSILEQLRKSRHQSKDSLEFIENVLQKHVEELLNDKKIKGN